ncbi:polymorphic toxin-type HINT domain-containing protein [Roseateles sp. SL47]|uniref:RHS repeat-associated core domain-containing protein n=1 Tax=Roseateles sp. SL47 TaxID=2995138 RepID=UPI002271507D|nr:RHS repeat-associated core domain-containing protein [Roseateles sp. SL47]WAC73232.1 polymorphic toxin-type HINT domain-containing protein [Roseateles sp. SL47]
MTKKKAHGWSRQALTLGVGLMLALSSFLASGQGNPSTSITGVSVSQPNGYAVISVDDMRLMTTAGEVRWARMWDGQEWKFQPQWESLSQSWKNLTGSQSADTTAGTVSDSSGSGSSSGSALSSSGSGGAGSGCWVWVDEDWQPSVGTAVIGGIPEVGPMVPVRTTPFNRLMGEASADYPPVQRVSVDYAGLCAGSSLSSGSSFRDTEGIRRINELYLGDSGRYAFSNRSILEKRAVQQLPVMSATTAYAQLASGRINLNAQTNAKGFRWIDRSGDWIDYNTQGQMVGYGDRNNNAVWMLRDSAGILRGVVDANGRVLWSLHYTGELLTEIRDYPASGIAGDLPSRSVKYQYDDKNRLTQVTDVRGNVTQYEYDVGNHITKVTDPEGRVDQLAYSGDTVKQRIAPDGGVTDYFFDYDDTNKQFISKVTGPETAAGRRVDDFTYNRVGKLVRRIVNGRTDEEIRYDTGARAETNTNARGFSTRTTRNEFDQTIEVSYPDGGVYKRAYSALHLGLTEEVDPLGNQTVYDYDAVGNLIRKTEAAGTPEQRVTEYTVNERGQFTRVTRKGRTESNGTVTADAVWQVAYDSQGQISQTTDPEGGVRRYQYDRFGNLISFTDPRSNTTVYQVDAGGQLLSVVDPLRHSRTYQRDKVGNVVESTDARGKKIQATYDGLNRRLNLTNPVGGVHRVRYNAQGLPISETDEDGRASRAEFDNFLRQTRDIDGMGHVTQLSYDLPDGSSSGTVGGLFDPTETQYPSFTLQQRYDALERLTSESLINTNAHGTEGLVSTRKYDRRGNLTSETDAKGKTHTYRYDALGQLIEVADSQGKKTTALFDARGNLIEITDANGNVNKFVFDRLNRTTAEILPLGQTTSYRYDIGGNLVQKNHPDGNRTEYAFDALNRLSEVRQLASNDVLLRTTNYQWDEESHLIGWTDADHSRNQTSSGTLTYDAAGRQTGESVNYPNGPTLSYGYGYSSAGYKTSMTWADNTTLEFAHSAHGQLQSVTIPGEGTISVDEFKWLEPTKVTVPGGTTQQRTLDGLLYLEDLKVRTPGQQTLLSLSNTWGKVQELKSQARADTFNGLSSTQTQSFSYDDENRLTEVQSDGSAYGSDTERYTLDAVGNRIAHSKVNGAWTYDANNRLTQIGNGSCGQGSVICFAYDAAGNLTSRQTSSRTLNYRYDALNRLIQVDLGPNAVIARYGYDPLDRRLWKEQFRDREGLPLAQAQRTYFLYAEEGLIAEATQPITLGADGQVTASAAPRITTQYGLRPDSEWGTGPLFIKTVNSAGQDVFAYYHHDQQLTPLQASDKSGRTVWSASYSPFGRASITTPVASVDQPVIQSALRLPGQYEDAETGLHYNYRRYYDPDLGRYISQDPIGLEGGLNQYQYGNGDPVNQKDPTGECPQCAAFAVCMASCALTTALENAITGECNNWGNTAKDCAIGCAIGMGLGKLFQWGKKLWDRMPCPINSFPGETMIQVQPAQGAEAGASAAAVELKPIRQLKVGDRVLAIAEWKKLDGRFSPDELLSYEPVTDIFTNLKEQSLIHLTLSNGARLTATEGHPLMTPDGWRDAVLLRKGDAVVLRPSHDEVEPKLYVVDARVERKLMQVFNLEVANVHTYFVGKDGVGVHNGRCTPSMRRAWEKLHGRPWPKNPPNEKIRPGGNQDGHHIQPVSKGGHPTDPANITPMTPSQHMDWHKKNGYK